MNIENETQLRQKSLQIVHAYFEAMRQKDVEAWSALWDEDAVVTVPVAEQGMETEYRGFSTKIKPGMIQYISLIKTYDYQIDAIHPSADPEIVIVDWDMKVTVNYSDHVYKGKGITVFTIKNNKIIQYQDYFNSAYFEIVGDSRK